MVFLVGLTNPFICQPHAALICILVCSKNIFIGLFCVARHRGARRVTVSKVHNMNAHITCDAIILDDIIIAILYLAVWQWFFWWRSLYWAVCYPGMGQDLSKCQPFTRVQAEHSLH